MVKRAPNIITKTFLPPRIIKHATAFLGFEGHEIILGEPLGGIKRISVNEFQEKTQWTKLAVIIAEE